MSLVKIKYLFHFEKGSLQSTKATPGDYDFITAAADWKTHNEYTHDCEALIFAAAASGSLGRTHYVNGKFISSDLCFIITPKDPEKYPIDLKFYHLIFNAFKDKIVRNTKAGTSKEAIGLTVFGNYKLPYFEIGKQQETKESFLKAQDLSHSLNNELSNQLELIKNLRHAYLKEAMEGNLVEQDPNDEPASVLLKKIKIEKERLIKEKKIKKEKDLPPISKEEIPFEIPNSWEWCRLGYISEKIGSGSTPKGSNYSDHGFPFFRSQNIHDAGLVYDDIKFINSQVQKKMTGTIVYANDILLNITGGSLGRCALVPENFNEGNVSQHVCIIRPILCNNAFIHKLILSPFFQQYIFSSTTGAGREGLPKYNLEQFIIPLPPIFEQQRILSKLNELMKLCDYLESNIIENQQIITLNLQQILREALGLKPNINEAPKIHNREKDISSKFDSNTLLMEIIELLKIHGKLQAIELWQMSKFYGKSDEDRNIDGFYAELKKLIEKEKLIKETEKGYLELV